MTEPTNPQAANQSPVPDPALRSLDTLVGTWTLSGETTGQVRYEWMEGGFFLLQHMDFEHGGHTIKGLEVIGRHRPFGAAPSEDIHSRVYDTEGNTLDYVYELKEHTLMIWGGEKGAPAYYHGTFSEDGNTCTGAWVFPGGGGYTTIMTKVVQ